MDDFRLSVAQTLSIEQLLALVQQLRSEVAALTARLDQVQAENRELKRENAQLKQQVAQKDCSIAQLRGEVEQLKARLFAPKSEKAAGSKSPQKKMPPELEEPSLARKRGRQPGQKAPQRRQYDHLPVVEQLVPLTEEQCVCGTCGARKIPHGTDDSEQIEIEVKAYRRRYRLARARRTCQCPTEPVVTTAELPGKLIPRGYLGNSVFVDLLLAKYDSHLPVERWLAMWKHRGLDLSAGTIFDGLRRITLLLKPIHDAILARTASGGFAQADETRWLMFVIMAGKTGHMWWLWAFLSEDAVGFRLDPTRAHDVPEKHFAAVLENGASMVLMVDRYSAYKAMKQVKLGLILLAFCWSHVRRDFIEAYVKDKSCGPWAINWLKRIRALYGLQRERLEQHQAGDKVAFEATTQKVRECLKEMHDLATSPLNCRGLIAVCRPVLTSLLTHWEGLTRFVDDVRIPLDNNASERAQRGPALGRKNYWGACSQWGGDLAAAMFSLMATLHLNEINPRAWLNWYLSDCHNGEAPSDIAAYLPWNLTESRRSALHHASPNSS